MLKMLSLFAGIGGMDLAAQWAGIETVAFCEIEPFCQKVLRKNFGADIVIFDDVRKLTAESLRERGVRRVDIICGGFPCQDVSSAGKRAGIEGERSGLWSEYFRIICELRPRYIVIENVTGLLDRGIGRVLRDLAARGFDAEWQVLSACAVGAPHARERVFIVAYPSSGNDTRGKIHTPNQLQTLATKAASAFNASIQGRQDAPASNGNWGYGWPDAARVCGGGNGPSFRVDRLRALGNAVVPQVCYPIFEAIMNHEAATR